MTLQALKSAILLRLSTNRAKRGTQKAKLIEHEYLQGYLAAHVETAPDGTATFTCEGSPFITICMMSGRSILD